MAETAVSTSEAVRDRQEPMPAPPEAVSGAPEVTGAATGWPGAGGEGAALSIRPPASTAPALPTAATPLGEVAAQILPGLVQRYMDLSDKNYEARVKGADAIRPLIEKASGAVEQAIANRPPMPLPPPMAAPPSLGLHAFLDPVDGEPPTRTISKLIQAMGLFAIGIGGAARGDVRSGMSALIGAMNGWQLGDAERANREFADWEAKTGAALKQWEVERTSYLDIMNAANLDLQQRFRLVELKAMSEGNDMAADIAAQQDVKGLIDFLSKHSEADARLVEAQAKMVQAHEDRVARQTALDQYRQDRIDIERRRLEEQAQRDADRAASRAEGLDLKRMMVAIAQQNANTRQNVLEGSFASKLPQEAIDNLATVYNATGQMPPMGAGMAGTRAAIYARAAELLAQKGLSPEAAVAGRQLNRATQNALNTNLRMAAQIGSFIETSNRAIEMARELNEQSARTGVPVLNKWIQAGRRAVGNDPTLAQFDIATTTVAAEYARVMSSATGGGVSTNSAREHAFSLLNGAQTPQAYNAALDQMHREMEQRVASFQKETAALLKQSQQGLPGITAPAQPGAPAGGGGRIRVRRKSDGQPGEIDANDPNIGAYERIK